MVLEEEEEEEDKNHKHIKIANQTYSSKSYYKNHIQSSLLFKKRIKNKKISDNK